MRVQFWLNFGFVGSISSHFRNLRIFYANFGISLGSYGWLVVELRCHEVAVLLAIFGDFYAFPTLIFYRPNFFRFFELRDNYHLSNTSYLADFLTLSIFNGFYFYANSLPDRRKYIQYQDRNSLHKICYHPFVSIFLRKNPENSYVIFWYKFYIHKPYATTKIKNFLFI